MEKLPPEIQKLLLFQLFLLCMLAISFRDDSTRTTILNQILADERSAEADKWRDLPVSSSSRSWKFAEFEVPTWNSSQRISFSQDDLVDVQQIYFK